MNIRPFRTAVAVGVLLSLTLLTQTSAAVCGPGDLSDYCSTNYGLVGQPSALDGRPSAAGANLPAVASSALTVAGPPVHADHLSMEAEAKALLEVNKQFRQDISPHNEKPDFDDLVRQFDYESGFDRTLPNQQVTLEDRMDRADLELRRARDIYAYLAVYADEPRFRLDRGYCSPEPVADDPIGDPPENAPVIDWCNFSARMRETVREVAYLRMIFGQQFMTDALGLHFSGDEIVGGDAFVLDEVRKLEMALEQYAAAELAVFEGMTRAIGDGCYVSDFYAESEWALTARTLDGKERARHHLAIRKSYLNAYGLDAAQEDFRSASVTQYVNLIGIAGISGRAATPCMRGTRPDSAMLAEIALRMLDTRQHARTMSEGRNVFGFDVQFTPARPFIKRFGSNDEGLYEEAMRMAERAKELQREEEQATRTFEQKKTDLIAEIRAVTTGRDERIQAQAGCARGSQEIGEDEAYFACVQQTIDTLERCDPTTSDNEAFEACVQQAPTSDLKQSMQELRAIYLQYLRVKTEFDNILVRASVEELRNEKVNTYLYKGAQETAVFESMIELASCCSVSIGFEGAVPSFEWSVDLGAGIRGELSAGRTMRQAANDMQINSVEKEAVIRNLFLDQAELQVEIDIAIQEYNAKLTEYRGIRDQTLHDVIEAKRDRAYLQISPANDPSFRIVRDSKRLKLAGQLEDASKLAYLAARRAEYENAMRLSANGIAMSRIYRARTADEIIDFLEDVKGVHNDFPRDSRINTENFRISVAQHILGLSDEYLGLTGDAAEAERIRRFRAWVAENTGPGTGPSQKPVLTFNFSTSLVDNGVFSNVIQEGFQFFWLFQLAGIGQPKPDSTGMSMNLVTNQGGDLSYQRVVVTQSGVTHLRTEAGCIFNYRLIDPKALMGRDFPSNLSAAEARTDFKASINGNTNGELTSRFLGRPVSASSWEVQVLAGAPEDTGLDDLDLGQLKDIELDFSTTRASRPDKAPPPEACVRGDF